MTFVRVRWAVGALLSICLFAFPVVALGAAPAVLSVSQSISLGVAQSTQVKLAQMAVTEAERNLDRVSAEQLLAGYRKGVQTNVDALAMAKMGVGAAKDDVAARIEQAYFAVVMSNETVAIRTDALATAKRQRDAGKAKLKAGLASKLDVESLENNLVSTQYSLEAATRNQRLCLLRFNRAMGSDLEAKPRLNDKLAFSPVKVDLKPSLDYALRNRRDMIQARTAVQRREEELLLASTDFTPAAERDQMKLDLERAKISLADTTKDAVIAVEEAYANLRNTQNEVDNRARALSRAQKGVGNTELKFKNGLAQASDLVNAQANYENAQLQRLQGVNDYRASLSGFLRAIGKEHPALASPK